MWNNTRQYEARVIVKERPVTEFLHTDGNIYIEGRRGSEFELEFYNATAYRVLVVPSIDGLSVMDGKTAGLDSSGYVVSGYQRLSIPGWRLDADKVAKFLFEDTRDSYANTTGRGTSNNGVIGFMVFQELYNQWSYTNTISPMHLSNPFPNYLNLPVGKGFGAEGGGGRCLSAGPVTGAAPIVFAANAVSPVCSANTSHSVSQQSMTADLGTGFGDESTFQTTDVSFKKRDENNPDAILVIYYDSLRHLRQRGINVGGRYGTPSVSPFPGTGTVTPSCPPPPNWRRHRHY